jgi:hypothetical protein
MPFSNFFFLIFLAYLGTYFYNYIYLKVPALLIRFVRYRTKKFIWPNVEDEAIVDSANIVRILPNLTEYQRGISFSVKVDGFNINLLPSSNSYLLTENETFS